MTGNIAPEGDGRPNQLQAGTNLLENSYNMRALEELLAHEEILRS
jgi:hypothetical protein